MKHLLLAASACALVGVAACSDTTDDVVEVPAAGGAPAPVSETRADTATTTTAVALGMTRQELEDADVLSGDNADIGDVDTLVLDASGQVTSVVVELDAGDRKVAVPLTALSSILLNEEVDLKTTMTAEQLAALPAWTPAAAS